jgi:acyl carrier protein
MSDTVELRLSECFRAMFPDLSPAEIARATSSSMPNWDSMATVTLVALVEEEFGVRMTPDDYVFASSYPLLLDYLRGAMNV